MSAQDTALRVISARIVSLKSDAAKARHAAHEAEYLGQRDKLEDAARFYTNAANLLRDVRGLISDAAGEEEADTLRERLEVVVANHPDPRCVHHADDDPITCGWKRAYTDVLNELGEEGV